MAWGCSGHEFHPPLLPLLKTDPAEGQIRPSIRGFILTSVSSRGCKAQSTSCAASQGSSEERLSTQTCQSWGCLRRDWGLLRSDPYPLRIDSTSPPLPPPRLTGDNCKLPGDNLVEIVQRPPSRGNAKLRRVLLFKGVEGCREQMKQGKRMGSGP